MGKFIKNTCVCACVRACVQVDSATLRVFCFDLGVKYVMNFTNISPGCSVVRASLMVRWVIGSILHGEPSELFLVPASAPRLV